ncbi:MAG TPA: hypothetical protein VL689_22860 [Paraburkholderia sp.]|nr:hypothetical protein [Paraburkholderia sp.]
MSRYVLRLAGAGAMLSVALAASAAGAVTTRASDYTATVDTLSDIRSAIAEITRASGAPWSGPDQYKASAKRVLVILQGTGGAELEGNSTGGAMGRIEHLLDRQEERPWEPVMEGVLANLRAAVGHLQDAGSVRSLDDYTEAMSLALENLEVAQGRPGDIGVLGGVTGAATNTELAVPPGAKSLDGCRLPHEAGYGVHGGYLAYRAVPLSQGREQVVPLSGGENIRVAGDLLVIYTAAAPLVKQQCEEQH